MPFIIDSERTPKAFLVAKWRYFSLFGRFLVNECAFASVWEHDDCVLSRRITRKQFTIGFRPTAFPAASPKVTKVGHSIKKALSEEGNEEAGYRSAWQVSKSP